MHRARNDRVGGKAGQPEVERPILSMIEGAADAIADRYPQAHVVGLLATSGTIASDTDPSDGHTPAEQLAASRERVLELVAEHSAIFLQLRRELAAEGIEIVDYGAIPEHHDTLRQRFHDERLESLLQRRSEARL